MSRAFETNVRLLNFSLANEAKAIAAREATVCAGTVIEIGRVQVKRDCVTFWGLIPHLIGESRFVNNFSYLSSIFVTKPHLPCSLSTTWNSILNPDTLVGYLVLNNFGLVETASYVDDWDEEDGCPETVLCGLTFERVLFSLPDNFVLGTTYCEKCGRIIPSKRLAVLPSVLRCIKCQQI